MGVSKRQLGFGHKNASENVSYWYEWVVPEEKSGNQNRVSENVGKSLQAQRK